MWVGLQSRIVGLCAICLVAPHDPRVYMYTLLGLKISEGEPWQAVFPAKLGRAAQWSTVRTLSSVSTILR